MTTAVAGRAGAAFAANVDLRNGQRAAELDELCLGHHDIGDQRAQEAHVQARRDRHRRDAEPGENRRVGHRVGQRHLRRAGDIIAGAAMRVCDLKPHAGRAVAELGHHGTARRTRKSLLEKGPHLFEAWRLTHRHVLPSRIDPVSY